MYNSFELFWDENDPNVNPKQRLADEIERVENEVATATVEVQLLDRMDRGLLVDNSNATEVQVST